MNRTAKIIAMWSGPRNISTAMMRSWENRADTQVWDEPFYGYYLARTGLDHPGRDAVIAAGETDWRAVIARATRTDAPVFYQKHMTHHLLPEVERYWLTGVCNCFLIRHPREVLLSYIRTRAKVTAADIGFPQQAAIFDTVCQQTGTIPPVIDAKDVLTDPEAMLKRLCHAVGVDFDRAMLSWPSGPRDSDGVWAPYWYDSVYRSTGFAPYRSRTEPLPTALASIVDECMPYYQRLYQHRLGAIPTE